MTAEKGILRDQIALAGAQGLRLALGFCATVLLMRHLPDAFWVRYVLVVTGLALALQVVDAGLGGPLAAALSRGGAPGGFRRRIGRTRVLLALGAAIVGVGAAMRTGVLGEGFGAFVVGGLLVAAVVAAPLRAAASALVAARRETPRAILSVLSQILFVAIIAGFFAAGHREPVVLLTVALVALALRELTASLGLALVERYGWEKRKNSPTSRGGQDAEPPLGPVLFASAVGALYLNADVFIVAWLGGETEVARYGDASRLASPLFVLPALVISPLTRAVSRGGRRDLSAAALVAATPLLPGLFALSAAAEPVLAFVRDRASPESAAAFAPLALAGLGIVAGQVGALALHARGASATWARIAVGGLVANLGLDVALVPAYGASGAAFATLITELGVGATAILAARRITAPGSGAESDPGVRATIAGPAALVALLLLGGITACAVHLVARHTDYPLVGSAALGALGTLVGLFLPAGRSLRRTLAATG